MPRKRKEEVTIEPGKGLNLDPELIKQLVPGTLDRATINDSLRDKGLICARAQWWMLISALTSTKNASGERDPEMHQSGVVA
ncbi:hypothetical protein [Burkholderia sp. GbtcB21]|uniref:hypothetical protein n=1 Tax=Burkholderia sp. GbtcB21 TaxID=2824766 RepID=UPI001C30CA9E|nr:hypothetical protein [Burkholderia sp. GbtcB21]